MIPLAFFVIVALFLALEAKRDTHLLSRKIRTMANTYDDLLQQFNDGTNAVAARIDALVATVAADAAAGKPASAEQIAGFKAIADHLKAMGTSPADPIPAPAPTPAPEPTPAPVDPSTTPSA